MDLQKTIRFVRGAFIFLIPLVGVLLYVNPIQARGVPQAPVAGQLFWGMLVFSLGDLIAMQAIAANMLRNLGPSDPAVRSRTLSTGAIILGVVGLSPLVYAVIYYLIGGPVTKALMIAATAILGHFMFIALIPKLTDASTSSRR